MESLLTWWNMAELRPFANRDPKNDKDKHGGAAARGKSDADPGLQSFYESDHGFPARELSTLGSSHPSPASAARIARALSSEKRSTVCRIRSYSWLVHDEDIKPD
jgi:hypothetical protein